MSPSPRSSRARSRARFSLAALPVLALAGAVIQGCGGPSTESAALPVPKTSADTACPISGATMSDVLRSSRTVLLRSADGVCAYGVPAPTGRAEQAEPIARISAPDDHIGDLRKQADSPDPMMVSDRPDLGASAFSRYQPLLNGRERATLVFPRAGGVWTVSVDMPAGQYSRSGAMDRAEGIYDLLVSRQ